MNEWIDDTGGGQTLHYYNMLFFTITHPRNTKILHLTNRNLMSLQNLTRNVQIKPLKLLASLLMKLVFNL